MAIAAPISSDAVAAGDGAFEHVQRAPDRPEREVVDELAVGAHGLGPDARGRRREIGALDLRHQLPHRRGEPPPAQ